MATVESAAVGIEQPQLLDYSLIAEHSELVAQVSQKQIYVAIDGTQATTTTCSQANTMYGGLNG